MVPPSRLPTRTVVGLVRRPRTAVVGVVSVLFVCAPSDYSVMEALESDGVDRAAREAFASEDELEASCDPDDRSISGEIRLSSTDPWEVVLRNYQELMSSNGWAVEGRIPMCYQKSVDGRLVEAYPLREQRTEDGGVKMVIAFSARPGGCELLNDPELGQEWMKG